MALINKTKFRAAVAFGATLVSGASAMASSYGKSEPWQLGLQAAASPVAENIHWFHDALLMPIITVTTLFVLLLLILVVARFNRKANPTPSQTTHHVGLEVAWTLLPVLILVVIAVPSFRLLKEQVVIPKADITLKVTGNMWFWSFEYPKEAGGLQFDARMLSDEDIATAVKKGRSKDTMPRLLAVDNEVVLPVNKVVAVQVTATDVIHAFAVQSFGVKIDAVPGRLNQTWFKATREGVYYGQCQELCGKDHAFMPMAIRIVSEQKYQEWLANPKRHAMNFDAPVQTAATAATTR